MLASVDWHLLILFGGLFVVTGAFGATGIDERLMALLGESGLSFADHLRSGVPMTLLTMLATAGWLAMLPI